MMSAFEEVLNIDVVMAVARLDDFTVQFAVPPDALAGVLVAIFGNLIALSIIDTTVHRGPHLPPQVVAVDVDTFASADVAHRAKVPLLDKFARTCIIQHLSQHVACVLLNSKGLQTRTFGIDVARAEAVAVGNPRIEQRRAVVVHRISTLNHLVTAIAVHIADADLVECSTSGRQVE